MIKKDFKQKYFLYCKNCETNFIKVKQNEAHTQRIKIEEICQK